MIYIALLFVVFGLGFLTDWHDPARCIFVRPECSAAFGAWVLCLVSAMALFAAIGANLVEVVPQLGESRCGTTGLCPERNVQVFVYRDIQEQKDGAIIDQPIPLISVDIAPKGFNEAAARKHHSHFENLGRSAIERLLVTLNITRRFTTTLAPAGGTGAPDNAEIFIEVDDDVHLGYLPVHGRMHVTLLIAEDFHFEALRWTGEATCTADSFRFTPLPGIESVRTL